MIEAIKAKLWSVLKDKEASLAMVYDRRGRKRELDRRWRELS